MDILFFDTETTGLPKNWRAPMSDLSNWPRIIQLAFAVYDDAGNFKFSICDLIKPDGWTIPVEKFWIDNGYNTEKNEKEGRPILTSLELFLSACNTCHTLVSHNMSYDYNVIGAEMIRAGVNWGSKPKMLCTKDASTDFCQLPGNFNKFKWPKLSELHMKLFNEDFENAHDALADVKACARCFFALKEKGIIK
jgi:DNA polymerase III epsilon subunit-like protein